MAYEIAEHGPWSYDYATRERWATAGLGTRLTQPEQVAPTGRPDTNAIDVPVFKVPGAGGS